MRWLIGHFRSLTGLLFFIAGASDAADVDSFIHPFDLEHDTVYASDHHRMWSVCVMITVFVFSLLPNATTFEFKTRATVKPVEVRNDRTVLKNISAHNFNWFIHAVEGNDEPVLLLIESEMWSVFVLVFVFIPLLLSYLSVGQSKNCTAMIAGEGPGEPTTNFIHIFAP